MIKLGAQNKDEYFRKLLSNYQPIYIYIIITFIDIIIYIKTEMYRWTIIYYVCIINDNIMYNLCFEPPRTKYTIP